MSKLTALLPRSGMMLAMFFAAAVFLLTAPMMHRTAESYAQTAGGGATPAPQGTPAQGQPTTVDAEGKKSACRTIPEAKGGVLLGVIVPCLAKTIETTTTRITTEFIKWMMPTIWAFITFVVVLFGVKILQGEGQIQTHGLVLLIKITLVMAFLAMIPTVFVPSLYGVMSSSQAVVMATVGPDTGTLKCDISRYSDGNTPLLWAQMDCIMGKLWGFTTGTDASGNKTPNMLLASSVFGLLAGFFFGGTLGAVLFFACIGVLWSMFLLIIRITMAFLNAYLAVSLYLIIAPLFMPLIFLKVTTTYFDNWMKGIIAGLMMPMLVCAYATVAFQLYDRMLFADDSLVQNLFKNDWVQEAQQLPRQACNRELLNDPRFRADASGRTEDQTYGSHFLRNDVQPMLSGANDLCGATKLPVFNLDATKDSSGFAGAKAKFEKLFRDMVKLLILSWLVNVGFSTMMGSLRLILGSGVIAATLDATSPQEQKMKAAMGGAKSGFIGAFRNQEGDPAMGVSGAQFIQRMGSAVGGTRGEDGQVRGGAFGGFMSGFTNR